MAKYISVTRANGDLEYILLADTKDIGGVAHGQMILQLPEETVAAEKMIQYLKERNLEVEELKNYVG